MNSSQQHFQGRSDPLASLRTEGLGFNPIFPPSQMASNQAGLNSSATPFMPSNQSQRQQYTHAYRADDAIQSIAAMQASLEEQMASMRLQSALSQQPQQQQRNERQANTFSALHGQAYNPYANEQNNQHYMQLQLQQHLMQQQLAAKQQQIELLRLQALQQQQQQQQQQLQQRHQLQAAAHQRFLLSQLQGGAAANSEYDYQSQAAASAQEQRQAAQASIQASLRQRQAQQLYQAMGLDGGHISPDNYGSVDSSYFQGSPQQRQPQLHNSLDRHTRKPSGEQVARLALDQRSWRVGAATPPVNRVASPASSLQSRKTRPSSGTADSILSIRSRTMTPSIVIDDSASEGSRAFSDGEPIEGDQTPETSEEDLDVNTPLAKTLSTPQGAKYGSLGRSTATLVVQAPKAIPRAISLSAAPATRAFTRDAKANQAGSALGGTVDNTSLTLPAIQPRRQPKGQPTEFKNVNFQARINSRTRRDAMSKLCASPRAASFGGNGLVFGSRISSAGSIASVQQA